MAVLRLSLLAPWAIGSPVCQGPAWTPTCGVRAAHLPRSHVAGCAFRLMLFSPKLPGRVCPFAFGISAIPARLPMGLSNCPQALRYSCRPCAVLCLDPYRALSLYDSSAAVNENRSASLMRLPSLRLLRPPPRDARYPKACYCPHKHARPVAANENSLHSRASPTGPPSTCCTSGRSSAVLLLPLDDHLHLFFRSWRLGARRLVHRLPMPLAQP